ncbi:MAG: hypothetical protein OEY58_22875 [Gammaproteobacteria bacterium]|nr:hypothetical protein [Gammaproteobacteria bacterium]
MTNIRMPNIQHHPDEIFRQQIETIYKNAPFALFSCVFGGIVVLYVLWPLGQQQTLVTWYLTIL